MRRNLLATCLAVLPHASMAQDNLTVDADSVAACLETANWNNRHPVCIGRAANACMELPEGSQTLGITTCLAAETEVWRSLLDAEVAATSTAVTLLDSGRAGQYAATLPQFELAQAAWAAYVAAQCSYEVGLVIDGTISGPTAAACEMQAYAERTVALRVGRQAL